MDLKRELAPGCFGSPTAYQYDGNTCAACPFASICAAEAERRFAIIQQELGHTVAPIKAAEKPASVKRLRPAKSAHVSVEGLPKKAADLVRKIAGVPMTNDLRGGRNPFAKMTPAYMRETCAALIDGGFTRKVLRERFMVAFSWSQGTASGHVSFIIPALKHLDVIEEQGDVFKIKGS